MVFVPFPSGALAIIDYGLSDTHWTNTLWFADLDDVSPSFQDLSDYLMGWSKTNIMTNLATAWAVNDVTVYDMSSETGQVFHTTVAAGSGSVSGTLSPVNAALVVTFYTANRGRSSRGRNYITGFVEDDVGATEVTSATRVTNIDTAYSNLVAGVQQNTGFYWVVASRYSDGSPREEVFAQDVLNVVVRSAKLGSQRRRVTRN